MWCDCIAKTSVVVRNYGHLKTWDNNVSNVYEYNCSCSKCNLSEIMNQWANMFILFQKTIVFFCQKKIHRKKFWNIILFKLILFLIILSPIPFFVNNFIINMIF
jgi:hypothetical protein